MKPILPLALLPALLASAQLPVLTVTGPDTVALGAAETLTFTVTSPEPFSAADLWLDWSPNATVTGTDAPASLIVRYPWVMPGEPAPVIPDGTPAGTSVFLADYDMGLSYSAFFNVAFIGTDLGRITVSLVEGWTLHGEDDWRPVSGFEHHVHVVIPEERRFLTVMSMVLLGAVVLRRMR